MGGAGDDRIYGRDGRDLIIGGTGADRIYGDEKDDILMSGLTAFYEEFNQLAPSAFNSVQRLDLLIQRQALEAILREWTSSRAYATRRNNIMGIGSGTRFNGNYLLKATGSSMTANTVFDVVPKIVCGAKMDSTASLRIWMETTPVHATN